MSFMLPCTRCAANSATLSCDACDMIFCGKCHVQHHVLALSHHITMPLLQENKKVQENEDGNTSKEDIKDESLHGANGKVLVNLTAKKLAPLYGVVKNREAELRIAKKLMQDSKNIEDENYEATVFGMKTMFEQLNAVVVKEKEAVLAQIEDLKQWHISHRSNVEETLGTTYLETLQIQKLMMANEGQNISINSTNCLYESPWMSVNQLCLDVNWESLSEINQDLSKLLSKIRNALSLRTSPVFTTFATPCFVATSGVDLISDGKICTSTHADSAVKVNLGAEKVFKCKLKRANSDILVGYRSFRSVNSGSVLSCENKDYLVSLSTGRTSGESNTRGLGVGLSVGGIVKLEYNSSISTIYASFLPGGRVKLFEHVEGYLEPFVIFTGPGDSIELIRETPS